MGWGAWEDGVGSGFWNPLAHNGQYDEGAEEARRLKSIGENLTMHL